MMSDSSDVPTDEELDVFAKKVADYAKAGSDSDSDISMVDEDGSLNTRQEGSDFIYVVDREGKSDVEQTTIIHDLTNFDGNQSGQKIEPPIVKSKTGLSSELKCAINDQDTYLTSTCNLNYLRKKSSEVMATAKVNAAFEKLHEVPPYEVSLNQQKKQRQASRLKTKGPKWFDLQAQELTEEKKNELDVIRMRGALDPKRFYKRPDLKKHPKFFQTGVVVEGPADYYSSRIPKKQRKPTLVDELLADAKFQKYKKRKKEEIFVQKSKGQGAFKHMKRLKKNKNKKR